MVNILFVLHIKIKVIISAKLDKEVVVFICIGQSESLD